MKNGDKVSSCEAALLSKLGKFGTTPHMFINAYKSVHLVAIATDYTLPHAEKLKEYFKDPSKFAVAAADAGAEKSVAAPAEERKEEPAE
ncbi:60S acidic ribosomal protein P0-like isoform X2 [Zingiber officinale]|uniref:60S acidic ribosomal protein P0-like isoform X2 n=1 Tax=Zingiber officinale TaxID=94328 RepID=UPI001C4B669E|nr:60S acidic ribosomal protein P0-like isoform X2 [Zingiber officinale]